MIKCSILLIRHPEAKKNIEDRHGGEGSALTKLGIRQCNSIARYIKDNFFRIPKPVLFWHRVLQVEETAKILEKKIKTIPVWDERLKGINLGSISGLSREKAIKKSPEAAERLELWRKGELQISQLNLPNAEPVDQFKERMESLLNDWFSLPDAKLIISICTRSALIMLVNLINLGNSFSYSKYKVYNFDNASITQIDMSGSNTEIVKLNYLKHLYENV